MTGEEKCEDKPASFLFIALHIYHLQVSCHSDVIHIESLEEVALDLAEASKKQRELVLLINTPIFHHDSEDHYNPSGLRDSLPRVIDFVLGLTVSSLTCPVCMHLLRMHSF